jgi:rhomboid protease GluP
MPRKKGLRIPISFSGLLIILGLLTIFWLGFLYVLAGNGDSVTLTAPFLILLTFGILILVALLRRKAVEKKKEGGKPKRKPIWDVAFAGREPQTPTATYGLMAFLGFVFILELAFAVDHPPQDVLSPGIRSLVAFGGASRDLVTGTGAWYRLFTAVLLHGGIEHFICNAVALLIAGKILENFTGKAWLLSVFAVSGLGGTLMSLAVNPENLVTVGASGAIMGLTAASYSLSFKLEAGADRKRLQSYLLQVLVLNLLPFLGHIGSGKVDYGAHLGGALAGLAMGFLLYFSWEPKAGKTSLKLLGTALAAGGAAAYLTAAGFAVEDYGRLRQMEAILIPEDQAPAKTKDWMDRSAELADRYPKDPRAHFYRAYALWKQDDLEGTEKEFRLAREDYGNLQSYFKPAFGNQIVIGLALTLAEEGRLPEAKEVAHSVCAEAMGDTPVAEAFKKYKLCD